MTKTPNLEALAGSYAGFVARGAVYLHEVIECHPGSLGAFAEEFAAILGRPGSRLAPVGAWQTLVGMGDEVTHLYRFDCLEDAETFFPPPGAGHHLDTEPSSIGRLVRRRTSKLLRPIAYPRFASAAASEPGRIFQAVQVRCTRSGLGAYLEHFADGLAGRARLSPHLVPVGAWRALYGGPYYEVEHLYAYDDLAEMEELRRTLYQDEEFQAHMAVNTSPNLPNFWEWGGSSKLLRALPYSTLL